MRERVGEECTVPLRSEMSAHPRKVKDLATMSFVEVKANAALLGPPEGGKNPHRRRPRGRRLPGRLLHRR